MLFRSLVIVTLLATMALPSLGGGAERARLKSAAETLASDLAEARFEAARRGSSLRVDFTGGADWCWVVATQSGCPCGAAQSCQLKAEQAKAYNGIQVVSAQGAVFAADGSAADGGGALFQSSRGEQLRVSLAALGRARICAVGGSVRGYPAC